MLRDLRRWKPPKPGAWPPRCGGFMTTVTTPLRTSADGLRNQVNLDFTGQITELLGFEAAYQSIWYDYFQNASDFAKQFPASGGIGSHGALLNRIEHLFDIKGTWQVQEH